MPYYILLTVYVLSSTVTPDWFSDNPLRGVAKRTLSQNQTRAIKYLARSQQGKVYMTLTPNSVWKKADQKFHSWTEVHFPKKLNNLILWIGRTDDLILFIVRILILTTITLIAIGVRLSIFANQHGESVIGMFGRLWKLIVSVFVAFCLLSATPTNCSASVTQTTTQNLTNNLVQSSGLELTGLVVFNTNNTTVVSTNGTTYLVTTNSSYEVVNAPSGTYLVASDGTKLKVISNVTLCEGIIAVVVVYGVVRLYVYGYKCVKNLLYPTNEGCGTNPPPSPGRTNHLFGITGSGSASIGDLVLPDGYSVQTVPNRPFEWTLCQNNNQFDWQGNALVTKWVVTVTNTVVTNPDGAVVRCILQSSPDLIDWQNENYNLTIWGSSSGTNLYGDQMYTNFISIRSDLNGVPFETNWSRFTTTGGQCTDLGTISGLPRRGPQRYWRYYFVP